jgi:hypothetical protein
MRFPHNVDDGLREVVVCGGPTIFPPMGTLTGTGIEKLPMTRLSKSGRFAWKRDRRESVDESFVLELDPVVEGGGRCTR